MSAGSKLQPRLSTENRSKHGEHDAPKVRISRSQMGDVEQNSAEVVVTSRRVLYMPLYGQHRRTLVAQTLLFSPSCPRWIKAAYTQRFAAPVEMLRWLPCRIVHASTRAGHPTPPVGNPHFLRIEAATQATRHLKAHSSVRRRAADQVTSQTIGTAIFGAYSLCRADGSASDLAIQRVAQDNDAVTSGWFCAQISLSGRSC